MQHYELLYIVPIQYAGEALQPIVEEVRAKLIELGAKITLEEDLGKRKFAYKMKGHHQGFYFLVEFDGGNTVLPAFEKWMRLKKEVLRYLAVKKDPLSPEKAAMQAKYEARRESERQAREQEQRKKVEREVAKEKTADSKDLKEISKKIDEKLEKIQETKSN
jgi:small subunit ribosomal protein S6